MNPVGCCASFAVWRLPVSPRCLGGKEYEDRGGAWAQKVLRVTRLQLHPFGPIAAAVRDGHLSGERRLIGSAPWENQPMGIERKLELSSWAEADPSNVTDGLLPERGWPSRCRRPDLETKLLWEKRVSTAPVTTDALRCVSSVLRLPAEGVGEASEVIARAGPRTIENGSIADVLRQAVTADYYKSKMARPAAPSLHAIRIGLRTKFPTSTKVR
jgi:hypothetical protein